MKPRMEFNLLFVLLLVLAPSLFAEDSAKVTIFRYKEGLQPETMPGIWIDEVRVANLGNGRYLVAQLPAGRHTIHSTAIQSGIELDMKPGMEYFVQVKLNWLLPLKRAFEMSLIPPEQAAYGMKNLKLQLSSVADVSDFDIVVEPPKPVAAFDSVVLSPKAQKEFDKCMRKHDHKAFAVSSGGSCQCMDGQKTSEIAKEEALGWCRRYAGSRDGETCKLIMIDGSKLK